MHWPALPHGWLNTPQDLDSSNSPTAFIDGGMAWCLPISWRYVCCHILDQTYAPNFVKMGWIFPNWIRGVNIQTKSGATTTTWSSVCHGVPHLTFISKGSYFTHFFRGQISKLSFCPCCPRVACQQFLGARNPLKAVMNGVVLGIAVLAIVLHENIENMASNLMCLFPAGARKPQIKTYVYIIYQYVVYTCCSLDVSGQWIPSFVWEAKLLSRCAEWDWNFIYRFFGWKNLCKTMRQPCILWDFTLCLF